LILPAGNINSDYPFPRVATEGDAVVLGLVFHPEIRFPSPLACPNLGVSEAELAYDFRDALLTLLSGRN
jgi:hypothetical protein